MSMAVCHQSPLPSRPAPQCCRHLRHLIHSPCKCSATTDPGRSQPHAKSSGWRFPSFGWGKHTSEFDEFETSDFESALEEPQALPHSALNQTQAADATVAADYAAAAGGTAGSTALHGSSQERHVAAVALDMPPSVDTSTSTASLNLESHATASPGRLVDGASGLSVSQAGQERQARQGPVTSVAPDPIATLRSVRGDPNAAAASPGGWLMAFTVMLAIKLSREQSDDDRLDLQSLQLRQQESRVQSRELREKRRMYLEGERVRKEAEAARRVQEAQQRAAEAEKERIAREAVWREEQSRATAKVMEQQAAARKTYDEQQQLMGAELQRRTEVEMRIREEREQRKREQEEARRLEAEARAAEVVERQRQAEEQARQRADEEAARLAREAQERRDAQTTFVWRFSGDATCVLASVDASTSSDADSSSSSNHGSSIPNEQQQQQQQASGRYQVQLSAQLAGCSIYKGSSDVLERLRCRGDMVRLSGGYETADLALEGGADLAVRLSDQLAEAVRSAAALTASSTALETGDGSGSSNGGSNTIAGPASQMDDLELTHWIRVSRVQLAVSLRQAVAQVAPLAGSTPLEQAVQVLSRWMVLPSGHPSRTDVVLARVMQHLQLGEQSEAAQEIGAVIQEQEELVMTSTPLVPPAVIPCLVYAHLLERITAMSHTAASTAAPSSNSTAPASSNSDSDANSTPNGSSNTTSSTSTTIVDASSSGKSASGGVNTMHSVDNSSSSSPAAVSNSSSSSASPLLPAMDDDGNDLHGVALAFARRQLTLTARAAALDSLTSSAWAVRSVLGARHSLTKLMAELAEQNFSPASRRALEVRKQQEQLAAAAAALQSNPRTAQYDRALPNSRARAPVAEQLWALRNVANKMVASASAGPVEQGVALLAQAAQLAGDAYGEGHPGQLSCLVDLRDALYVAVSRSSSEVEAQQLARRAETTTVTILEIVQAIADRYVSQREPLSAALLLESALRELAPSLPHDHPAVATVRQRVQQMCDELGPASSRIVVSRSAPSHPPPGGAAPPRPAPLLVRQLARDLTEQLGVYSTSKRSGNIFELWNKGLPLPPLR